MKHLKVFEDLRIDNFGSTIIMLSVIDEKNMPIILEKFTKFLERKNISVEIIPSRSPEIVGIKCLNLVNLDQLLKKIPKIRNTQVSMYRGLHDFIRFSIILHTVYYTRNIFSRLFHFSFIFSDFFHYFCFSIIYSIYG